MANGEKKKGFLSGLKITFGRHKDIDPETKKKAGEGLIKVAKLEKAHAAEFAKHDKKIKGIDPERMPMALGAYRDDRNEAAAKLAEASSLYTQAQIAAKGEGIESSKRDAEKTRAQELLAKGDTAVQAATAAHDKAVEALPGIAHMAMVAAEIAGKTRDMSELLSKIYANRDVIKNIGGWMNVADSLATAETLATDVLDLLAKAKAEMMAPVRGKTPNGELVETMVQEAEAKLAESVTLRETVEAAAAKMRPDGQKPEGVAPGMLVIDDPELIKSADAVKQAKREEDLRWGKAQAAADQIYSQWLDKVRQAAQWDKALIGPDPWEGVLSLRAMRLEAVRDIETNGNLPLETAAQMIRDETDTFLELLEDEKKVLQKRLDEVDAECARITALAEQAAKHRKPYEDASKQLLDVIKHLNAWSPASRKTGADLQKRHDAIVAQLGKDRSYEAAATKMIGLAAKGQKVWDAIRQQDQAVIDQALQALHGVKDHIRKMDKGLAATAFDTMVQEVKDLEKLLQGAPHPGSAAAVIEQVAAQEAFIADYEKGAEEYKALRVRVLTVIDTVKKGAPDGIKAMIVSRRDEVAEAVKALPLRQAVAQWQALDKEMDAFSQRIVDVTAGRRDLDALLKPRGKAAMEQLEAAIREHYKSEGAGGKSDRDTHVFQGPLAAAMLHAKELVKTGEDPKELTEAVKFLKEQIERAEKAATDPTLKAELVEEHDKTAELHAKQQKQLDFMNQVFSKALSDCEAAMKIARNASKVKEAKEALDRIQKQDIDAAKEQVELSFMQKLSNFMVDVKKVFGSYDAQKTAVGIEIMRNSVINLRAAKRDIDHIAKDPMSCRPPSRAKAAVSTVIKDWNAALVKAKGEMDALKAKVVEECAKLGDDGTAAAADIGKRLDAALKLFESSAFDRPVVFMQGNGEAKDKLRAREQGLAEVRRQRALFDDPRVAKAVDNPFGVKVLTHLRRTLSVIEYKIVVHDCN